jgi:hypothetical protein
MVKRNDKEELSLEIRKERIKRVKSDKLKLDIINFCYIKKRRSNEITRKFHITNQETYFLLKEMYEKKLLKRNILSEYQFVKELREKGEKKKGHLSVSRKHLYYWSDEDGKVCV